MGGSGAATAMISADRDGISAYIILNNTDNQ